MSATALTPAELNARQYARYQAANLDDARDINVLEAAFASSTSRFLSLAAAIEVGDGGGGEFAWDAASMLYDNGITVIKPYNVDVSSPGRWRRTRNVLDVKAAGAVGDGVADDTAILQSIITAFAHTGFRITFSAGSYRTTSALTIPTNARRAHLVFEGGSLIVAEHTGDGLVINSIDETYGNHIIEHLRIDGPNVSQPSNAAELSGTSLGAGLKMGANGTSNTAVAYKTTLINPEVRKFKYGIYAQCMLLTKCLGGHVKYNQYGLYVDGGQTNSNDFYGFSCEENRVAGIYSSGRTGGTLTNAIANRFFGGTIQSNIPFRSDNPAGYTNGFRNTRDVSRDGPGKGVVLINSSDWEFIGTYFEDNDIDVVISGLSISNRFSMTRHQAGGAIRIPGIWISGAQCQGNQFIGTLVKDGNPGDVYLFTDEANNKNNYFFDTQGFNKVFTSCVGIPYFRAGMNMPTGSGAVNLGSLNYGQAGVGVTATSVSSDGPLSIGVEWDDASVNSVTKLHIEQGGSNPRAIRLGGAGLSARTFGLGAVDDGYGAGWAFTDLLTNGGAAGVADRRLLGYGNGDLAIYGIPCGLQAAPTIASAAAIAPTTERTFISGAAAIDTIVPTDGALKGGAYIILIPTGLFTWTAAGNIALAGAAVIKKAVRFDYDKVTAKWYPSYV